MSFEPRADAGFTLIEVVVAIVVLTIGVLALAASAAATVRSMAVAQRVGDAARVAEVEREWAFAMTCAAGAGVDSTHGASVTWRAVPAGPILSIAQVIALPRSASIEIAAAGPCR